MMTIDEARRFIRQAEWVFARTMPEHPHWYTFRKENPRDGFEAFVMMIREHGYREEYGGRSYTKLDIDGWSYWTMGAPLRETILVNRRRAEARRSAARLDPLATATRTNARGRCAQSIAWW